MCGICGFIDYKSGSNTQVLDNMISTLHHRGPDDRGCDTFYGDNAIVGLGHTRLSIIDISHAGHQPMNFEHLSIVLNGEIYNYKEIKNDLMELGHKFISGSDTEVVLHAFAEWGYSCLSRFVGMFVFVILNKKTLEIAIVRDRAGVKPLFYYWKDDLFLFSSELKAFHQHSRFVKTINDKAVHQYMDFGYVPSPYCIFENCAKLEPGHILKFCIPKKTFEIIKYWDIKDFYRLPRLNISYNEAQEELEKILISAFEYRMVSDVPVGVFLSGGYDSTAVTAILQKNRTEKLRTFTIGFEEGINEAPFAKEIAKYLGTDHSEYYCTTKETQEIIPDLPFYYDEPFADSSAIPTTLVSKLAKKSVTVALSADAGDEIFAGYSTYKSYMNDLSRLKIIPDFLRKEIVSLLEGVRFIIPRQVHLRHKISVLTKVLSTDNNYRQQELLRNYPLVKLNDIIQEELFAKRSDKILTAYDEDYRSFNDDLSIALAIDYIMYLQNDILTKVDRATMSVSLEGREPFLDHRIVEFVAQLPVEFKYGVIQKRILKDIVHKYIPKQFMDRPKAGFSIPIYSWLKKDIYYLLEENLNSVKIDETGLFRPLFVKKLKQDFLKGRLKDPTIIWKLLQFQMWYTKWNH
jgi:asparagine synthase (glutamine-hydrolysing)